MLNKRAVITGASRGIGRRLAIDLAIKGYQITAIARDAEALESLMDELPGVGHQFILIDLSSDADIEAKFEQIKQPVEMLINNAGVVINHLFDDIERDDFEMLMQVNFLSAVKLTKLLIPSMRASGTGHIVNVASVAAIIGTVGYSAYAPSKAALLSFSETLRNELAGTGIKVSSVLPTDVLTDQYAQEQQTKPVEARVVSEGIKPITIEQASSQILRGIRRGKAKIYVSTWAGKLIIVLNQLLPSLVVFVMDAAIKKARR